MQSARTSQMIVGVASAIEFFSSFTTLRPGDVIATGTPGGVGFARKPPVWLEPGDVDRGRRSKASARSATRVVAEETRPSAVALAPRQYGDRRAVSRVLQPH